MALAMVFLSRFQTSWLPSWLVCVCVFVFRCLALGDVMIHSFGSISFLA